MGERLLCKQRVVGPIPITSTIFYRPLAKWPKAPAFEAGNRWSESNTVCHILIFRLISSTGSEHWPTKPGVARSTRV